MIVQLLSVCNHRGIHPEVLKKISRESGIPLEMKGEQIALHVQKPEFLRKLYTIFRVPSSGRNLQYRFANYILWEDPKVKTIEIEKPVSGKSGNAYRIDVYAYDPDSDYDILVECRGTPVSDDDVKEIVEEVKDIAEDGKYLFDRIIIATNKPVSDSAIRGVKTRVIRMPKESYKNTK